MPRFTYIARDRAGKSVNADLDAPSRKDALRLLSARGFQVASVTEVAGATNGKSAAATKSTNGAAPAARGRRGRRSLPPRRDECLPFLEALHDLATSGL